MFSKHWVACFVVELAATLMWDLGGWDGIRERERDPGDCGGVDDFGYFGYFGGIKLVSTTNPILPGCFVF